MRGRAAGVIAVAVGATTLTMLPAFLVGTTSVFIRAELNLSETQLGGLLTLYLLTGGVLSTPMGRVVERIGPQHGIRLSVLASALAMAGIGVLATEWLHIAAFLLIGGVGQAAVHPAGNLAIMRQVREGRRGLAFGIKQSAIPGATFLAGVAVPLAAGPSGWRGAFLIAAAAAAASALAAGRISGAKQPGAAPRSRTVPIRPLLVLAAGAALAVGAVQPVGVFFVGYGVLEGLTPSVAGGALALGSVLNIATRIGTGALADRLPGLDLFAVIITCIGAGVAGMCVLGLLPSMAGLIVGVLVVTCLGWGWNALLHFSVARANPAAPAAATSVTQTGLFAGGAVGPIVFGATVETAGYTEAWLAFGAAMLAGGLLLVLGGRMLTRPSTSRHGMSSG